MWCVFTNHGTPEHRDGLLIIHDSRSPNHHSARALGGVYIHNTIPSSSIDPLPFRLESLNRDAFTAKTPRPLTHHRFAKVRLRRRPAEKWETTRRGGVGSTLPLSVPDRSTIHSRANFKRTIKCCYFLSSVYYYSYIVIIEEDRREGVLCLRFDQQ